ncbi:MAG: hypothetical protein KGI97_03800 [Alphaproteobacteria bacterium]|nr:hypothetical protein [Alphaproteobacteria bacterium]
MKKLPAFIIAVMFALCIAVPAQAHDHDGHGDWRGHGWHDDGHDHVHFSFGLGFGCCAYPPYSYSPYSYPPSVVYVVPPSPVYIAPARPVYIRPSPQALPATQTSPTYIDGQGRTCRRFQATMPDGSPVYGIACLQPDGTWRTVD